MQDAIRAEDRAAWVERMQTRPPLVTADVDVAALMALVRDELGG